MKKPIKIFGAVLLLGCLLFQAACGSREIQREQSGPANIDISSVEKNVPSEEQIKENLKVALQEKNVYASLTGAETIKSLTGDDSFTITLAITASTKYADWSYEADFYYTEYDQGWMIDNTKWISATYQIARTPDVNTMADYAQEYLENLDLCSLTRFGDFLATMQDFSISWDNEILMFDWTAKVDRLHDTTRYRISTAWEYEETIDNWIIKNDAEENNWEGYEIDVEYQNREFKQIDFSGSWQGKGAYEGFLIEIYDFTWEEFSANIPLFNIVAQNFERTTSVRGELSIYSGPFYTNENGEYICFYPQDSYTAIIFQDKENFLWVVEIHDELPELPNATK